MKDFIQRDRDSINIGVESLFVCPHAWAQSNKYQ